MSRPSPATRRRRPPARTPAGVMAKKRELVEALRLLRRLAQGPLTRAEAEAELRIPCREWYRFLVAFRLAGLQPARWQDPASREVYYSLSLDLVTAWLLGQAPPRRPQ